MIFTNLFTLIVIKTHFFILYNYLPVENLINIWSDKMVEVTFTYDFHPNIDEKAYATLAKKATAMMLSAKGFIEFRAHRNMTGSPHVRRTSVWASLADWAMFAQQPEFQKLTAEFRSYVTNLNVMLWGPSPITPDPIRP
jgi:heme-degrading monooxygenase HmoA